MIESVKQKQQSLFGAGSIINTSSNKWHTTAHAQSYKPLQVSRSNTNYAQMSMSTPINTQAPNCTCPVPAITTDDLLDYRNLMGPDMTQSMIKDEQRYKWTNHTNGQIYRPNIQQKQQSYTMSFDYLYDAQYSAANGYGSEAAKKEKLTIDQIVFNVAYGQNDVQQKFTEKYGENWRFKLGFNERKEVWESYLEEVQWIAEGVGEELGKNGPLKELKDVQKKAYDKKKQVELKQQAGSVKGKAIYQNYLDEQEKFKNQRKEYKESQKGKINSLFKSFKSDLVDLADPDSRVDQNLRMLPKASEPQSTPLYSEAELKEMEEKKSSESAQPTSVEPIVSSQGNLAFFDNTIWKKQDSANPNNFDLDELKDLQDQIKKVSDYTITNFDTLTKKDDKSDLIDDYLDKIDE